jgi:hypothetical protein
VTECEIETSFPIRTTEAASKKIVEAEALGAPTGG